MKTLKTVFFILMFAVPLGLCLLAFINGKKIKTNSKFKKTIIKVILLSFFVNGFIWGGLCMMDKEKEPDNQGIIDNKPSNQSDESEDNTKKPDNSSNQEPDLPPKPNVPSNQGTQTPGSPSTTDYAKPDKPNKEVTSKSTTSKGFEIEVIDGITYVDGYLIVNKTYTLPNTYKPTNTYKPVNSDNCADCLDKLAVDAYNQMKKDAAGLGLNLWVASGYRSYNYQSALYNGYVRSSGKEAADTYSARPGHSEHQSGYAFDLNDVSASFGKTKEGIWISANCYKYGFILRYPEGKTNETGYIYEPWHLRYVGSDLASKLYNNGSWLTMEDYFGLTSEYPD